MNSAFLKTVNWLCCLLAAFVCALSFDASLGQNRDAQRLPYNRLNPVVYDNDEAVDMYTDEYLLALSSLGVIRLEGVMTSTPIQPYDSFVTAKDVDRELRDREQLLAAAQASGLSKPLSMKGAVGNLQKPASGRIEDTQPIDNPGSRFIIEEAKKATVDRPLVIVDGAPLTAEASAYLLDPSIKDKVVVAWLGGSGKDMCDYNGWADPWAAYIVLSRLRFVQFPLKVAPPVVRKQDLLTLPQSSLQQYMYHKHHPTNGDPGDIDGDGPPAISLNRPDYPLDVIHVGFSRWVSCRLLPGTGASDDHAVPALAVRSGSYVSSDAEDSARALLVRSADQRVSTAEWWGTIRKALNAQSPH